MKRRRGPIADPRKHRSLTDEERQWRQEFKDAVSKSFDGDQEKAEVILRRVASRVGGYTHDDAARLHPWPCDGITPRGEPLAPAPERAETQGRPAG